MYFPMFPEMCAKCQRRSDGAMDRRSDSQGRRLRAAVPSLFFLLLSFCVSGPTWAERAGQVTALTSNPFSIEISGEVFRLTSRTRIYEIIESTGKEAPIKRGDLAVDDQVIFEQEGAELTRIQRLARRDIGSTATELYPVRVPE